MKYALNSFYSDNITYGDILARSRFVIEPDETGEGFVVRVSLPNDISAQLKTLAETDAEEGNRKMDHFCRKALADLAGAQGWSHGYSLQEHAEIQQGFCNARKTNVINRLKLFTGQDSIPEIPADMIFFHAAASGSTLSSR